MKHPFPDPLPPDTENYGYPWFSLSCCGHVLKCSKSHRGKKDTLGFLSVLEVMFYALEGILKAQETLL